MKRQITDLACFGGTPLFEVCLPVGQLNMPEWERFKAMADGIFERKYYTNHGVLARNFEEKLCGLFGVNHTITVTNATIGLMLACKALGLAPGEKVIVPGFTFAATVQALTWAGLEPVFCDIDPRTHTITPKEIAPLLDVENIRAVLPVNLWGNACDIEGLTALTEHHGLRLFFDSAHAVGCSHQGRAMGSFGDCEIFSFHATKVLSSTEGGCITTNNDALAEQLRNLRSSYGRHANVPIPVNCNGRFSEMQAAFGLLSLEDFPKNCEANKQRMTLYASLLQDIPGIKLHHPTPGERHNYQYVVLEIDAKEFGLCRDSLVHILEAENIVARRYFVPGMHRCTPYSVEYPQYVDALPDTDILCHKVMQMPSGQCISASCIKTMCELIRFVHTNANALRRKFES